MRVLVCADAHADLPALEAVLKAGSDVDRKVFLGDAITYGPHPKECLDLVVKEFDVVLAGNHDLAVAQMSAPPAAGKTGDGYEWDWWTRERLAPSDMTLIKGLPQCADEEWDGKRVHLAHQPRNCADRPGRPAGLKAGHAGPADRRNSPPADRQIPSPGRYMMPDIADNELLERIKGMPGEIIFVAHAHRQMDRRVNGRRVINPGSIGQQRDGNPRASYAIFGCGRIEFFRVDYDIARTISDVRALPLRKEFIACWCAFIEQGIVDMSRVPPR